MTAADPRTTYVLAQLRLAVNAHHRRAHRRALLATAVAVLALTGGTVAAATQGPWWQSGTPPLDPQAVASVARDNLPAHVDTSRARTVAQDGGAALVAVPIQTTGYCLIPVLDRRASLGAQCEYRVVKAAAGEDDRLESYAVPAGHHGGPAWIVYGRVTETGATKLDLGSFTVSLENGGFFVGLVPQGSWSSLDNRANAGRILDASGSELRSGCINWGPSPADPQAGRSDNELWFEGGTPCTPHVRPAAVTVDYSRAVKLTEFMLTANFSVWKAGTPIAFWRAPGSDGTDCVFLGSATEPDSGLSFNPPASASCEKPGSSWPDGASAFHASIEGQVSHVDHVRIYLHETQGTIDPRLGIVRVELRSASGTIPVALADNRFFAQIPGTSTTIEAFPAGGPFVLVGYDSSGKVVASLNVTAQHGRFGRLLNPSH